MKQAIVESSDGVTLVGGGPVSAAVLRLAVARAPTIVGADAGADRVLALGAEPQAVVGDFDSISAAARARLADRLFPIAEQATTDFDKGLRSIVAPFVLAIGFAGARIDHGLAVLTGLVAHPDRRCLVLGPQDVVFLCPPQITLALRPGDRLSLYPMGAVTGRSTGLQWPIDGIDFAPDGMIGTSNRVTAREVTIATSAPRMLVILPRARLDAVLMALRSASHWPALPLGVCDATAAPGG